MADLADKVAIVTGAASGIGAAVARRLLAERARVVLVDQDAAGLQAMQATLDPARTLCIAADVAATAEYVGTAAAHFGRVDLLHSNAGIVGAVAPIHDADPATFDRVFAVNVRGSFLAIQAAAGQMRTQGGGSIVVTSSVSGVRAGWGFGIYGASKAALILLAKTAAIELGPLGIRVNLIAPGLTDTPAFRATSGSSGPADETVFSKLALPIARIGTPDEVANLVVWLFGDQASYATGGLYHLDGGLGA